MAAAAAAAAIEGRRSVSANERSLTIRPICAGRLVYETDNVYQAHELHAREDSFATHTFPRNGLQRHATTFLSLCFFSSASPLCSFTLPVRALFELRISLVRLWTLRFPETFLVERRRERVARQILSSTENYGLSEG